MSQDLGIVKVDSTIEFVFSTNEGAGGRVAPSAGFTTADFKLYKDGGTTERTSVAGWTVSSPFDTLVGIHQISIDLSDNTDAGFYATAGRYKLIGYPTPTVDGENVSFIVGTFEIRTYNADDIYALIGAGGASLGDLGGMSTAMIAEVNAAVAAALATYDGPTHAEMTAEHNVLEGEHVAINANVNANEVKIDTIISTGSAGPWTTGSGGDATEAKQDSILANQVNIEADTQDIQTQIGTAGAGLSDLGGMSTAMKAEVLVEALKPLFTNTLAEIVDMTDVPTLATIAQAITLFYQERRNGVATTASLHQIYNNAAAVVLEQDLTDDDTTATASKLRAP